MAVAQEARFVSRYAAEDAVTGTETIVLLAIGRGLLEPDAPMTQRTLERASLPAVERYANDEPLSLAEFAYLVATYFEIQPSLMGRLFPGPRYSIRDLRSERIIFYEADAATPVPGEVALRVIGRAVRWRGSR